VSVPVSAGPLNSDPEIPDWERPLTPTATRHPSHLRAIFTVPLLGKTDPGSAALWRRTLPDWTLDESQDAAGALTPAAERMVRLITPAEQPQARANVVALAYYPQSGAPPPLLAHLTPDRRAVRLRIFASDLTELQTLTERVTEQLRCQPSFGVSTETRVIIAIVIDGVRHDLTRGRVRMGRGGVFRSFYQGNKYALNVTLVMLLFTLSVVLALTPTGPYTPLGKFYGLSERLLSAVLLSALLLFSQFLYFVRHRGLIAWERP
jgi:hypothetical protein